MSQDIIEIKEKFEFKLTTKMLSKLSIIINKMGISSLILEINEETGNEEKDNKKVTVKLLSLIIDNLYKAEDEITSLVAEIKGITKEEAENVDIIPILKDFLNNETVSRFLNLS